MSTNKLMPAETLAFPNWLSQHNIMFLMQKKQHLVSFSLPLHLTLPQPLFSFRNTLHKSMTPFLEEINFFQPHVFYYSAWAENTSWQ